MKTKFNKGEYLKDQFNEYWSTILNNRQDYFSQMTDESFELLKLALGNINNIITYNTTLKAVKRVSNILGLSTEETILIEKRVKESKPSDNGFDIEYSGSEKIICEVKCNRPVNGGNRFGSAQKTGIDKDISALLNGKVKSKIDSEEIHTYYKFMTIYNFDSNTTMAIEHYLLTLNSNLKGKVEMYHEGKELSKDIVYIILLK